MADGLNVRLKKVMASNASTSVSQRRKSRQSQPRKTIQNKVLLDQVLGITTSSGSGLTCDPNSGLVAYPAGCVVVLLHPRKNEQSHILNTSRKTFTALAFSQDGKYLVTGECGHMPCVRVWDVTEKTQVAEVQCHKHGVACVAFSPNNSYIVSVGYQHDMTVSVWEWRKGIVIASNKVSSRVLSVSFSEDNSYFVTAGNRHVKFWYLDASKEMRINSTVPLIGRSGILGEQRNSLFCGLVCGRGAMASSTYCITSSGLLCQFNSRRLLDSWVELKTSSAHCLFVSEQYVFCGCANGTVRIFSPENLHYITTLHRPHCLGVDVSQGVQSGHLSDSAMDAQYPDTLALTFDPVTRCLTCVYNDHSVYVWDVHDICNVGKVYSALYHSGCVWNVETYPYTDEMCKSRLHPGSFLTCSSDNTIRLWNIDHQQHPGLGTFYGRNLYSHDLVKIVYVGKDTQYLKADGKRGEDSKSGIRVLRVSPDGRHLAAGDRSGNLRIYGMQLLDELLKIEAHDSEILCLEFSTPETGLHLLASASRDRLIHIFNMEKEYSLQQTVYDHSAAITAIKFTGEGPEVHMVSCGADKSIYFRTAEQAQEGLSFSRSHHVVEKATLYDMDLDSTRSHTAIACQDRNIRVYNVKTGKMTRCFKGSLNDDGTLLKVQMDPSGMLLATSCSDKNISIFDYESGECIATLYGHSEIVTGMRFSQDCRHLITVSGDGCIFVWRLDTQLTNAMRKRLFEMRVRAQSQNHPPPKNRHIRRQTYITVPGKVLLEARMEEEMMPVSDYQEEDHRTPGRDDSAKDPDNPMFLQTNGKLPMWARRLGAAGTPPANPPEPPAEGLYQPRGRWAEQSDPQAICCILENRSLQLPLSPSPQRTERNQGEEDDETRFHPQSLDSLLGEEEATEESDEGDFEAPEKQFVAALAKPGYLSLPDGEELFPPSLAPLETSDYIVYPANSTALSVAGESEFDVRERTDAIVGCPRGCWGEEQLSPDSACCVGSAESQISSQDAVPDVDTDCLSQVSSTGSSGVEEEDEEPETLLRQHFDTLTNEKFDMDLSKLLPTDNFLNPRLSISARFLSRFQNRAKTGIGLISRPTATAVTMPPSISEESISQLASPSNHELFCNMHDDIKLFSGDPPAETVSRKGDSKTGGDAQKLCKSRPLLQKSSSFLTHRPVKKGRRTIEVLQWNSILPEATTGITCSQPGCVPTQQNYMGTTASSRAKVSRNGSQAENINVSIPEDHPPKDPKMLSTEDLSTQECKENLPLSANLLAKSTAPTRVMAPPPGNHSARARLQLDLSKPSSSHKLRRRTVDATMSQPSCLATPTEMRSLGKEGKNYITIIESSITSNNPGRSTEPRTQSHSPNSYHLHPPLPRPLSNLSSPLREGPIFVPAVADLTMDIDDVVEDEPMNMQTCKTIVNEMQQSLKKALTFYNKLCSAEDSPEQLLQMKSILTNAFVTAQSELDHLCIQSLHTVQKASCSPAEESPGRQLKDDRTVALLEKYSEMLLRIAEKKMDCN